MSNRLPENAKKWLKALRSGEFHQGKQFLRDDRDGYCCLGVACEVYRRETGLGDWEKRPYVTVFAVDGSTQDQVLPDVVRDWLGLKHVNGGFTVGKVFHKLTSMNDEGYSFQRIAYEVELHWDAMSKE